MNHFIIFRIYPLEYPIESFIPLSSYSRIKSAINFARFDHVNFKGFFIYCLFVRDILIPFLRKFKVIVVIRDFLFILNGL